MSTNKKMIADSNSINSEQFKIMVQAVQHLEKLRTIRQAKDYESYRKLENWLSEMDTFLIENDELMNRISLIPKVVNINKVRKA